MRISPPSMRLEYTGIKPLDPKYSILGTIEIEFGQPDLATVIPLFMSDEEFLTLFEDMLTHAYDHGIIDMRLAERMSYLSGAVLADGEKPVSLEDLGLIHDGFAAVPEDGE